MKNAFVFAAGAALWLAGALPALAADATAPADATPSLHEALPASELAAISGGANTINMASSQQNVTALNSGNEVNGNSVVTGNVNIDPSAFSGFNGIGNFVFNTGNNNNLQGSLSVTILVPGLAPGG